MTTSIICHPLSQLASTPGARRLPGSARGVQPGSAGTPSAQSMAPGHGVQLASAPQDRRFTLPYLRLPHSRPRSWHRRHIRPSGNAQHRVRIAPGPSGESPGYRPPKSGQGTRAMGYRLGLHLQGRWPSLEPRQSCSTVPKSADTQDHSIHTLETRRLKSGSTPISVQE